MPPSTTRRRSLRHWLKRRMSRRHAMTSQLPEQGQQQEPISSSHQQYDCEHIYDELVFSPSRRLDTSCTDSIFNIGANVQFHRLLHQRSSTSTAAAAADDPLMTSSDYRSRDHDDVSTGTQNDDVDLDESADYVEYRPPDMTDSSSGYYSRTAQHSGDGCSERIVRWLADVRMQTNITRARRQLRHLRHTKTVFEIVV